MQLTSKLGWDVMHQVGPAISSVGGGAYLSVQWVSR